MAVSKANLVSILNTRLIRAETTTTLADEIRAVLKFISGFAKWKDLWANSTGSLSSGDLTIAEPAGFRVHDAIILNDSTYNKRPLEFISYRQYLRGREDEASANYDEPLNYARRGGSLYLDPVPDGNDGTTDWAYTWYYWRFHPDQDEILFGDEFEEAMYEGVMWKYLTSQGVEMSDGANYHMQLMLDELRRLKPTDDELITYTKGDLGCRSRKRR